MTNFYEPSLKERLERANHQFSVTYSRKLRYARLGVCTYPFFEIRRDLYAAAGDNGLFAEALKAYMLMLSGRY
jgi:hypothetical protein